MSSSTAEDYVKSNQSEFADQLDKFKAKLPGFSGKYGVSSGALTESVNDANWFRFYFNKHEEVPAYAKAWTALGKERLFGTGTVPTIWPVGADTLTPPPDVLPGIVDRYRAKVQAIKGQKLIYVISDGETMGFEPAHSVFDPESGKPDLKITLIGGGHPYLTYTRSKYAGIQILKDSGDGKGFQPLFIATNPYYTDNSALPAANTSALWKYMAIYMFDDKMVGEYCDPIPVTVKGI